MRIRLTIERNELPTVSILWPFTSTQLTSTIAQFLEAVNVRFPLEGNTWGLEDYTVSLGGYEAQHYTQVGQAFKDDDEVLIKPLLFAEARARTIGGRSQITSDGRRLVDGVPFGKALLKRMRRPDVDIPPARKRARLEDADADEEQNVRTMVRFEEVEEMEDHDDDEDDGDFEDASDSDVADGEDTDDEEEDDEDVYELRMPIRAIFSKQCCLQEEDLALGWDEDNRQLYLNRGSKMVRLPGSDVPFTIDETDVAASWSTVTWTSDRADHRAILKGRHSGPSNDILIEFTSKMSLNYCYLHLMDATKQRMKSVLVSEDYMRNEFALQQKSLLAAHKRLLDRTPTHPADADEDDDEEDDQDFEDEDSSDNSDDSDSDAEAAADAPDVSSDDDSDSSISDDSSGSDDSSDDTSSDGDDMNVDENDGDDTDSSDADSSESEVIFTGFPSEPVTPAPPSIPLQGAPRTKARNERRRDAARLKYLKKAGELPGNTTLKQMQEWLRTGELSAASTPEANTATKVDAPAVATSTEAQDAAAQELEEKRLQLLNSINGGGIDVSASLTEPVLPSITPISTKMLPPQLKKAKKKSKAKQSSLTPDDDRPEEIPIATEPVIVYPAAVASTPTIANSPSEPAAPASQSAAAAKRRQDKASSAEKEDHPTAEPAKPARMSAAQRLIFGSLGLKTPKTQAEKDALQKKLAARPKKPEKEIPAPEPEVEDEDPEAWRKKVEITAVECCDEGVVLSAPPFPFQQRWDPQYWKQNKKKRDASGGGRGGIKNKRRKGNSDVVETYDKYNQDGGGDALNYDDPIDDEDDEWDDGEEWEAGALLGADEEEEDDGFPALPDEVSSLPGLAEADAKTGDFVVFTEMACSDATGWQPQMVSRIALLASQGEEGWNVQFPKTKEAKEYDDEGNRIYKKFEMEGYDEDEEAEDNGKVMQWAEMMEIKLLQRPAAVEEIAEVVTDGDAVAEQIQSQLQGEMGRETSSADQ